MLGTVKRIADLVAQLCDVPLAIVTVEGEADEPESPADPLVAAARGYAFYAAEPLIATDGQQIGTLCILDRSPRELTPALTGMLRNLAALATDQIELRRVVLQAQETADQLQDGLESNRTIGKAIGLLMTQYHLDDDAAFEKLRGHSRDLNIKVRDLAEKMVGHHNSGCRSAD